MATRNVLLRVEGLAKEIAESDILVGINFEIRTGEILGLIAPNGAGKTTLLECLTGLRPRTAGTFYIGDEAPPDWDPRGLMFYLPNNVAPYAELYTLEVLTLVGRLYDVEPHAGSGSSSTSCRSGQCCRSGSARSPKATCSG